MSEDYQHACERAELLGLPKPSEEEWRQTQAAQSENRCDDDDGGVLQVIMPCLLHKANCENTHEFKNLYSTYLKISNVLYFFIIQQSVSYPISRINYKIATIWLKAMQHELLCVCITFFHSFSRGWLMHFWQYHIRDKCYIAESDCASTRESNRRE